MAIANGILALFVFAALAVIDLTVGVSNDAGNFQFSRVLLFIYRII